MEPTPELEAAVPRQKEIKSDVLQPGLRRRKREKRGMKNFIKPCDVKVGLMWLFQKCPAKR